ncbi:DUF4198 domain-containing protein [Sphingomonas sp.]|jgi:uncharacterized GH25 family protein|uniref:DUF4198 domain-containing protein n=1 Tax=Sphingomonas sp. TaxID=28214 RepID=UPI00262CB30F|nr:DUF4198 domain-containing protein [Sphingomonas sp.]MDF2493867.1 hypothetical protein [Sphingomonas sp.]
MRLKTLLLAAIGAATLAAPAMAHRQWLLPSTTTLSDTNQYVTVDAAVSNDLFYPDHVAMRPEQIKVWAPDGTTGTIENAATGRHRTTFDVKVDKPGTWKIGTEMSSAMGSFKLNGEEWRVGGRRGPPPPAATAAGGMAPQGRPRVRSVATPAEIPAGATDVRLTEMMSQNATFVTAGPPSEGVFKPIGKGLEFQPITHPGALVADEEGQFRFLVDGKPAAGVKVTVVPGSKKFREAEGAQELVTGADGVLRVSWPVPGMYWMSATMTDAKTTVPRATERRMTFTTTLEVPAP